MTNKVEKLDLKGIVPEYHNRIFLVRRLFWNRIHESVKSAEIKDNYRVLDAGCGIGYLLRVIRDKNQKCRLYGIDINENISRLDLDANIQIADLRKLPYKDSFFDVVFALDVLEHLKNPNEAILEIRRVLKKSGKLVITGPTESLAYKLGRFIIKGTFSMDTGPCSAHYYSIYEIEKFIKQNKFEIIKKKNIPRIPLLSLFKLMVFKKR